MSRKVVLYIAASLDGYIARANGAVDWLSGHGDQPPTEDVDSENGYEQFYQTIDTVIMGRTTYEQIIHELSPDAWAYQGKKSYVATTTPHEPDEHVTFINEDIPEFVKQLKLQPGQDIWLVGGGKLIEIFMEHHLIDTYVITMIPTILGDGIPLFLGQHAETKLRLQQTRTVDGMVELTYVTR
ncbi:dihydrofolate reductase family protein [Paenibacillus pini]|uniref:Dihydrofolate reductase n=1 Tax=Paenibacillus pini JCM 16418 TaxID=1236976 RepID=W7YHW0_9BACL|nr:dihydrofolate reductase family protein [Paenibacillus pini]GAF08047.1 dihydrofolate reductase [Paenibacillus pini JCM 16418]